MECSNCKDKVVACLHCGRDFEPGEEILCMWGQGHYDSEECAEKSLGYIMQPGDFTYTLAKNKKKAVKKTTKKKAVKK